MCAMHRSSHLLPFPLYFDNIEAYSHVEVEGEQSN